MKRIHEYFTFGLAWSCVGRFLTAPARMPVYCFLLMAVVACDKDKPEDLVLDISLEEIQMNPAKDASLVIVTTLADWSVEANADWIHLSAYKGNGKTGFIVGADANPSFSRETVVTIKAGEKQQAIKVRQAASPIREIQVNAETIRFLLVDSGTFLIGSNHHPVRLSEYYIAETELTNSVWKTVMDTLPWQLTELPYMPVTDVDWNTIHQQFIPAINRIAGVTMSLPTEAQWEFAARGGVHSKKYLYSGSDVIDDVAWFAKSYVETKHPVARKKTNETGLYDMSGNAAEWCSDWYHEEYGVTALNDTVVNPLGPVAGEDKVVKGGSYNDGLLEYYAIFNPRERDHKPPAGYVLAGDKVSYVRSIEHVGFRLVISKN